MKKIYLMMMGLLLVAITQAQAPVFGTVSANTATPNRLFKFELNVPITAAYTNPYDYDDIALQCVFSAPSGKKDTVDGFFMQDYNLNIVSGNITTVGTGTFKVRYTPTEVGNYSYVLSCTNTVGTAMQTAANFTSTAAPGKGFIRRNSTNYLNFDNGEQYIPIGENMAWQQSNRYTDYKSWTQKLSDNNANFFRLWLCHWGFGIEWKNAYDNFQGLRRYKQTNAFYLDWLLEECRAKGLYMMLCINHHGQVSTTTDPNWSDNPYNAANGGPCTNTWDFFTNVSARATHKNRLRYIVARWGYSPNIQSWELFNEVSWTNNYTTYRTQITDWHNEMATYLKAKDPMKHLVTTSYTGDYEAATWNLPNMDFTQTHYYSGSGNIETVLNAGIQSFLTAYGKPTVNGEFGISAPAGTTIPNVDSTGTNIHNSIWATTFNGSMGAAFPWYWNDYIDPRNLYYHFNPLATVVANIPLMAANFKPTSAATVTSSIVSDVTVSPAAGYGLAPAGNFTVNADGTLAPNANNLSSYLFGSSYNTQNRNPPTFNVNYPVAGQFIVATTGSTGTAPKITIYVDGIQVLNQNAAVNSQYPVSISAGAHAIKVDNLGTDWIQIASYRFTNIGSPINRYLLKSADSLRVAGWLHNKNYNWLYLRNNGGTPPASVNDAAIQISGVKNGAYTIAMYNCITGQQTGIVNTTAAGNMLSFSLPTISWDVAFSAIANSALPIVLNSFTGQTIGGKNNLYIDIATSQNVKTITLERSADGMSFSSLGIVSANWSSIAGKHNYTDDKPTNGANFYRLKITDKDGTISWSSVVRLSNVKAMFSVYPNPFVNNLTIQTEAGKFTAQLTDVSGRVIAVKTFTSVALQSTNWALPTLARGTYVLTLKDDKNEIVHQQNLVK